MVIKKIISKIGLEDNVKSERADQLTDCLHDCVDFQFSGSTAKFGCRRKVTYSAKLTSLM